MADGWAAFKTHKESKLDTGKETSADAFGTRAFLHNDYMARMSGAALGIYGNSKDEAIYPVYFVDGGGKPLTGANAYRLHFAAGQLPPVNSFWSMTMYGLPKSLLYANTLSRYLINSAMLPSLKKDADGGLTLYVSHDSPGADKESNWLPAPEGPFFVVMRLYWPKAAALDGKWKAPKLREEHVARRPYSGQRRQFRARRERPLFLRPHQGWRTRQTLSSPRAGVRSRSRPSSVSIATRSIRRACSTSPPARSTITLPESHGRFMSMQMIDEDQYTPDVFYGAGRHTFTREAIGTRYLVAAVRTLVDPNDPKDLEAVHALQDAIKVEQPGGPGAFEIPHWDMGSQKVTREALLSLARSCRTPNACSAQGVASIPCAI